MSVRRALREAADDILNETWSDAARAASAAARRAKAGGGDWRKAGRSTYWKKQTSDGKRAALKLGIPSTDGGTDNWRGQQDAQQRLSMQDQRRYVKRMDAAGKATYVGAVLKSGDKPPSHTPAAGTRRAKRFANKRMPAAYNW